MVDTVQQMCVKKFEITAENGDHWECNQGDKFTTTKPKRGKPNITVFSNFWIPAPKKNFILVEK